MSAIPQIVGDQIGERSPWALILGLGFIAFGTGGIKPVVSTFIGDQLADSQTHLISRLYQLYYWVIICGALAATFISPIVRTHLSYWVAFLIPSILIAISTIIFRFGSPTYRKRPVTGSIISESFQIIVLGIKESYYATKEDEKSLNIILVFTPLPFFWALHSQTSSRWTIQASTMDLHLIGNISIEADQFQIASSLLTVIIIPLSEILMYRPLRKRNINFHPLLRMSIGMWLGVMSFIVAMFVQLRIDASPAMSVSVWLQLPMYLILTAGEVFVTTTGLEFAYAQAPANMKSIIMCARLLTESFGNLLVKDKKQAKKKKQAVKDIAKQRGGDPRRSNDQMAIMTGDVSAVLERNRVGLDDLSEMKEFDEDSLINNLQARFKRNIIYILPIYTQDILKVYKQRNGVRLPPHLFSVPEKAYMDMIDFHRNQVICISGESGSGKSENNKLIIQYLLATNPKHTHIENLILESGSILESFDFLDESRVSFHNKGERNFHIFYQFLTGVTEEEKQFYGLGDVGSYNYLTHGGTFTVDEIDDTKAFERLKMAFSFFDFTSQQIDLVFRTLTFILSLGNLTFSQSRSKVDIKDRQYLISNAISFDSTKLELIILPDKNTTMHDAVENRDSLAKSLYANLFQWIVDILNAKLAAESHDHLIGLLDLFGQENTQLNCYEHFSINYLEEQLQQIYIQAILKSEQEEYKKERIPWNNPITYRDNADSVELMEKIVNLLDQESKNATSTDFIFLDKLNLFLGKHHLYYIKQRKFGVEHYFGTMFYDIKGFIQKNRDEIYHKSSNLYKNSIIKLLFMSNNTAEVKNSRKTPLSIVKTLPVGSNYHFVRCLRPNSKKTANQFDTKLVNEQIKTSCLVETAKIQKLGYTINYQNKIFFQRFSFFFQSPKVGVFPNMLEKFRENGIQIESILSPAVQIGSTKIFLRYTLGALLEVERQKRRHRSAITIQKNWKMYRERRLYLVKQRAVVVFQKCTRRWLVQRRYHSIRAAIVVLESFSRMVVCRIRYVRLKHAAVLLQNGLRGVLAREYVSLVNPISPRQSPRSKLSPSSPSFIYFPPSVGNKPAVKTTSQTTDKKQELMAPQLPIYRATAHSFGGGGASPQGVTHMPSPRRRSKSILVKEADAEEFLFVDYAKQNFEMRAPKRSLIRGKRAAVSHEALVSFSKKLTSPLHRLDTNLEKLALECFNNILMYMGDIDRKKNASSHAICIIRVGLEHVDLRDEIYCQIVRQLTNHPKRDNKLRGWELMAAICGSFPPKQRLLKYVSSFLLHRGSDADDDGFAAYAFSRLQAVSALGSRALPPVEAEFEAVRRRVPLRVMFLFPDDVGEEIDVDSTTTAGDVAERLVKLAGLKSDAHVWAVFEIFKNKERSLRRSEYILDVISKWEAYYQAVGLYNLSHGSTSPLNQNEVISLEPFQFCFKIQLFLKPNKPLTNKFDIQFLFHQLVKSISKSHMPIAADHLAKLAALRLQYDILCNTNPQSASDIWQRYIPEKLLLARTPKDWSDAIQEKYVEIQTHFRSITKEDLRSIIINYIMSLPYYGSTLFVDCSQDQWSEIEINGGFDGFHVLIDIVGIHIISKSSVEVKRQEVDHEPHTPRDSQPISEGIIIVSECEIDQDARTIILSVDNEDLLIQSPQYSEMAVLVNSYISYLSADAKCAVALRDFTMPHEAFGFKKGDILTILSRGDDGWCTGSNIDNISGHFPLDYVQLLINPPSTESPLTTTANAAVRTNKRSTKPQVTQPSFTTKSVDAGSKHPLMPYTINRFRSLPAFKLAEGLKHSTTLTSCVKKLQTTALKGPRLYAPSKKELHAVKERRNISCKIHLANGPIKHIEIGPSTTALEPLKVLAEQLDLSYWKEFAIYKDWNGKEQSLKDHEKIADVIKLFEDKEKKAKKTGDEEFVTGRLVLLRKIWIPHTSFSMSNGMTELMFYQCVHDVLVGKIPRMTNDLALTLAALQLQAQEGDYNPDSPIITEAHLELAAKSMTPEKALSKYLEQSGSFEFSGTTWFSIYTKRNQKPTVWIGINQTSLVMFDEKMEVEIDKWEIEEVSGFTYREDSFSFLIGNLVNPTRKLFYTDQGDEINEIFEVFKSLPKIDIAELERRMERKRERKEKEKRKQSAKQEKEK
eukprot:gene10708-12454_t